MCLFDGDDWILQIRLVESDLNGLYESSKWKSCNDSKKGLNVDLETKTKAESLLNIRYRGKTN